jgi:hypothetical protein
MARKKHKTEKLYHFTLDFEVNNALVGNNPDLSLRSSQRLFAAIADLIGNIDEYDHVRLCAHRNTNKDPRRLREFVDLVARMKRKTSTADRAKVRRLKIGSRLLTN